MGLGIQWIVDKITFPSPPSSYSLTSHPELFFIQNPKKGPAHPGVPCMLYAIPQGAPVLLVHAHSNGCDIGDMRQTLQSISEQLRVHVMSFEFPGYGLHVGSACKASIDEAANLVLQYILEEMHLNPAQVVWYGRSIGSGPAVNIAHRITKELKKTPGGLILQCGYANFKEVAKHLFGRVAQTLVSPLWQNEVMMRDLRCPVLLIHGRADTMITIEHSERNFAAVSQKEFSKFHACECGHNDFNFQRCTLRPIYDFLLGVISAADFPSSNFTLEINPAHRAFVNHIGPLRNKIPVYSFRRPELEEWIRRLQARKLQQKAEGEDGDGGQEKLEADGRAVRPSRNNTPNSSSTTGKAEESLPPPGREKPEKKKRKKKGKGDLDDTPPIPNFCELPQIKDIEEALLDPEGMIRTCTHRVSVFLEHLQKQMETVDGLESKPLEEVIELVEAVFWSCDPLLCLWEEVRLPEGQWVRTRLGPFYIESSGETGFDPGIGAGRATNPDLLRVPIWVFCPSPAHFRCLAEWTLLHSERLDKCLPSPPASGSSCCCAPCKLCCRKNRRQRNRRTMADPTCHPTRGVLATSLAAHFVNWVDKTDEVRAIFSRFSELHRNPEQVIGRSAAAAIVASIQPQPLSSSLDTAEETIGRPFEDAARGPTSADVREFIGTEASASSSSQPAVSKTEDSPWWYADLGKLVGSSATSGQAMRPPWQPPMFSASTRMLLRDRAGAPGSTLSEFYASMWSPELAKGARPVLGDFEACTAALSTSPPNVPPEKNADWIAANILLYFDRLPRPKGGEASSSSPSTDLLRPEMREAGLQLNQAMKVFAHTEQRERRELMRHGKWKPTPKVPLPPDIPPDGDMLESSKGSTPLGQPGTPIGVSEKDVSDAGEAGDGRPYDPEQNSSSRQL